MGVTQTERRLIHLPDPQKTALSMWEKNTVRSVSCKICFHEPRETSSHTLCLKVIFFLSCDQLKYSCQQSLFEFN